MSIKAAGVGLTVAGAAALGARAAWWRSQGRPLDGRVAVVAGGSRGLGLAIGRELLRSGCRVSLWARDPGELSRAREMLAGDGEVSTVVCDVGDRRQVEAAAEEVRRTLGPVDLLFNVAGEIDVGPAEAMEEGDYKRSLDIMLWGMMHASRAVLPNMTERGWGRIVNITSIGGVVAVPHLAPYTTAKYAAVGFSEGLAAEVRRFGVRVTTVVPGLMRTGSHEAARFRGRTTAEYAWFALEASAPVLAMDAQRAAVRIVAAARSGRPWLVLGLPANLLLRAHALAPGVVVDALATVTRVLPKGPELVPRSGAEIGAQGEWPLRAAATRLGTAAAERLNQRPR